MIVVFGFGNMPHHISLSDALPSIRNVVLLREKKKEDRNQNKSKQKTNPTNTEGESA
jgi:hypothetical protein